MTTVYAGFLFGVLGLIAWASGQAFVFPSLGPSAFVLAFDRHADRGQLREIVLAHAIGCVGGFAAWTLAAPEAVITTTPPPFSAAGFELISSAVLSIVLTTLGMVSLGQIHPPRVCDDADRLAGTALDAVGGRDHRRQCRSARRRPRVGGVRLRTGCGHGLDQRHQRVIPPVGVTTARADTMWGDVSTVGCRDRCSGRLL